MELRKGRKEDAQAFVDLIQKVREGMTHPEWFYLDPPEETKRKNILIPAAIVGGHGWKHHGRRIFRVVSRAGRGELRV